MPSLFRRQTKPVPPNEQRGPLDPFWQYVLSDQDDDDDATEDYTLPSQEDSTTVQSQSTGLNDMLGKIMSKDDDESEDESPPPFATQFMNFVDDGSDTTTDDDDESSTGWSWNRSTASTATSSIGTSTQASTIKGVPLAGFWGFMLGERDGDDDDDISDEPSVDTSLDDDTTTCGDESTFVDDDTTTVDVTVDSVESSSVDPKQVAAPTLSPILTLSKPAETKPASETKSSAPDSSKPLFSKYLSWNEDDQGVEATYQPELPKRRSWLSRMSCSKRKVRDESSARVETLWAGAASTATEQAPAAKESKKEPTVAEKDSSERPWTGAILGGVAGATVATASLDKSVAKRLQSRLFSSSTKTKSEPPKQTQISWPLELDLDALAISEKSPPQEEEVASKTTVETGPVELKASRDGGETLTSSSMASEVEMIESKASSVSKKYGEMTAEGSKDWGFEIDMDALKPTPFKPGASTDGSSKGTTETSRTVSANNLNRNRNIVRLPWLAGKSKKESKVEPEEKTLLGGLFFPPIVSKSSLNESESRDNGNKYFRSSRSTGESGKVIDQKDATAEVGLGESEPTKHGTSKKPEATKASTITHKKPESAKASKTTKTECSKSKDKQTAVTRNTAKALAVGWALEKGFNGLSISSGQQTEKQNSDSKLTNRGLVRDGVNSVVSSENRFKNTTTEGSGEKPKGNSKEESVSRSSGISFLSSKSPDENQATRKSNAVAEEQWVWEFDKDAFRLPNFGGIFSDKSTNNDDSENFPRKRQRRAGNASSQPADDGVRKSRENLSGRPGFNPLYVVAGAAAVPAAATISKQKKAKTAKANENPEQKSRIALASSQKKREHVKPKEIPEARPRASLRQRATKENVESKKRNETFNPFFLAAGAGGSSSTQESKATKSKSKPTPSQKRRGNAKQQQKKEEIERSSSERFNPFYLGGGAVLASATAVSSKQAVKSTDEKTSRKGSRRDSTRRKEATQTVESRNTSFCNLHPGVGSAAVSDSETSKKRKPVAATARMAATRQDTKEKLSETEITSKRFNPLYLAAGAAAASVAGNSSQRQSKSSSSIASEDQKRWGFYRQRQVEDSVKSNEKNESTGFVNPITSFFEELFDSSDSDIEGSMELDNVESATMLNRSKSKSSVPKKTVDEMTAPVSAGFPHRTAYNKRKDCVVKPETKKKDVILDKLRNERSSKSDSFSLEAINSDEVSHSSRKDSVMRQVIDEEEEKWLDSVVPEQEADETSDREAVISDSEHMFAPKESRSTLLTVRPIPSDLRKLAAKKSARARKSMSPRMRRADNDTEQCNTNELILPTSEKADPLLQKTTSTSVSRTNDYILRSFSSERSPSSHQSRKGVRVKQDDLNVMRQNYLATKSIDSSSVNSESLPRVAQMDPFILPDYPAFDSASEDSEEVRQAAIYSDKKRQLPIAHHSKKTSQVKDSKLISSHFVVDEQRDPIEEEEIRHVVQDCIGGLQVRTTVVENGNQSNALAAVASNKSVPLEEDEVLSPYRTIML